MATAHTHAKIAQARADLERAVSNLRDSAAYRHHLAVMARFHRYSWHNQLLIACQRPESTYVRGFKAWLDAGRAVRKGERGIAIFAPRPWQRASDDPDDIESGVSFAVVHVFDVSQTDPLPGHPHPWQPPALIPARGDDAVASRIWDALAAHATALGLTLSTAEADAHPSPTVAGYFHPAASRVWVRPDRSPADMAATLAHELAHAVTHEATAALDRAGREVVAESVAYAVCSLFGLDLSLRSVDYLAGWADDPAAFRAGMAAIHAGAASLIDAVEAALAPPAAFPLAA